MNWDNQLLTNSLLVSPVTVLMENPISITYPHSELLPEVFCNRSERTVTTTLIEKGYCKQAPFPLGMGTSVSQKYSSQSFSYFFLILKYHEYKYLNS